ncbi:hypothetical protein A2296_05105 [candidate division CPR3 bacterium RIFOXYB2_FULL_35_8]|nr:MAG: hypothetical protein A2296_05105 [candidate division CPR3 bacterium RIFOXYB2_FULL_35_8]
MIRFYKRPLHLDSSITLTIFLILIICAFFLFDYVQITIHAFVNIFAGGRSNLKAILFLIYFLCLLLISQFIYFKKIKVTKKINGLWIWIGVIVAYLFNALVFFIFYIKNNFQFSDSIVLFNESEISSTSLLHNHILKGVTGLVLKFFHVSNLENYDGGIVFLDFISPIYFYLGFAILLLLLILVLIYFIQEVAVYKDQNKKYIYMFAYAIITFSLIKNLIDGGLFNYEAIVSFGFWTLLIFKSNRLSKYFSGILFFSYLLGNIVFYKLNLFNSYEVQEQGLFLNIWNTIAYIFLLLILFYDQKYKIIDRRGFLLKILTCLLLFYPVYLDLSIIAYRLKVIDSNNHAILGVYEEIFEENYLYLDSAGDLNFYEVSPSAALNVDSIIKKFNLLDNFYPLSFPWQNCLPSGLWDQYSFELISKNYVSVNNFHSDMVTFDEIKQIEFGDHNRYFIKMSIKPCYPRSMNVIQESFQAAEVDSFIIKNITKGVRRI